MSLQKVLRTPEFPVNQRVQVKFKHWNQFQTDTITFSGKRVHMTWDPMTQDYRLTSKNMFRFQNEIFSAYTDGLEIRLLNGTSWNCWMKEYVPRSQHKIVTVIERWPSQLCV